MCRSDPHTAVASTRINTSPGPGRGTGTDFTSVPAGPATGFVLTTAVIFAGRREAEGGRREDRDFRGIVYRLSPTAYRLPPAVFFNPRPRRPGRTLPRR